MQETTAAGFTGRIPDLYDRALGPVMFADYADDIARRVATAPATRVLETAAGTGMVTRRLRDRLPQASHLTATDLTEAMLEVARSKFQPADHVTFLPADATELPFPNGTFDAVVCQFGVMFFPDKDKSYREVRRVLKRNGRYLFSVWDSHAYNPFARVTYETAARSFPDDPPQFHRVPFGYFQIDAIKESLLESGFTDIRASVVRLEKRVTDPALFARGLIFGTPLIDQVRARGGDPERLTGALTNAFVGELGLNERPIRMQAIVFEVA
jgi:ubiquinone/menaquinone biosynthesis C-methylase UbiE